MNVLSGWHITNWESKWTARWTYSVHTFPLEYSKANYNRPMDQWTNGTMDQWTNWLMDNGTNGPMDQGKKPTSIREMGTNIFFFQSHVLDENENFVFWISGFQTRKRIKIDTIFVFFDNGPLLAKVCPKKEFCINAQRTLYIKPSLKHLLRVLE